MEFRPVTQETYDRYSIPKFQSIARKASETLGRIRPRWGAGRFTAVIDRIKKGFDEVDRVTSEAAENIELFRPFIFDEQLHLPRRQHPRAARPDAARGSGAAGVGAGERSTSTTTG